MISRLLLPYQAEPSARVPGELVSPVVSRHRADQFRLTIPI